MLACMFIVSMLPHAVSAQSTSPEAPGTPIGTPQDARSGAPSTMSVSVDAGTAILFSSGTLSTTCKCAYPSGMNAGPTMGLSLEYRVASTLSLALRVGYTGYTGEFTVGDSRVWYEQSGAMVTLDHERRALISMDLLETALLLRWSPAHDAPYLQCGPVMSAMLASHITETERIVTPGYVYPSTQNNLVQLADGELAEVRATRQMHLGLRVGGGWMIPVGASLAVGPELSYTFPLTSVFTEGPDWKLHSLHGLVRLRLAL